MENRYEIISNAGSGATSQVYCARDCQTGELVAVKVFPDAQSYPQFEKEVFFLTQLKSPSLQRYVDHGQLGTGSPFIALAWLEGQDLGSWFKGHALSMNQAISIILGTARGLAVLHAHNIVHRDIKPANILLADKEGELHPVIIDLGVAIEAHAPMDPSEHRLVGTPAYMSPELASMEAIDITPAIDVYSLCAVFYELLSGRRPHEHHHLPLLLSHIIHEPIAALRAFNPEVPEELEAVIMRGLARKPSLRFSDGQQLLEALEAFGDPDLSSSFLKESLLSPKSLPNPPEEPRTVAILTVKSRSETTSLEFFAELEAIAISFGGLYFRGDSAVLIIFGAEKTLGDEVSRALKAGFQMRGIHDLAATVILAKFGEENQIESALEMAHRLQQQPGTTEGIRVDGNTSRRARSEFNVVRKKGFSVVLGPSYWRGREGKKLYGRANEQQLLDDFLQQRAREGLPGIVILLGEDGMGKSTLCSWLFQRAGESGYRMFAATAQSENREKTYGVVERLMSARAGITDGHQQRARESLIERFLARHPHHQNSLRTLLQGTRNEGIALVGEALRWSIWEAVAAVAEVDLAAGPLFFMIDNFEQADVMSVQLLSWLLNSARGGLGLVITTTPTHLAYIRSILPKELSPIVAQLSPLNREDAQALVEETYHESDPHELKTLISRADGNPLFIEELANLYRQGGGERTVTRNIQISAQISLDQLSQEASAVVKAASILGERGDLDTLEAMMPQLAMAQVRLELEQQRLWLSYPLGHPRARTGFRFRHSLTRDAVYQLLTLKVRQELHLSAAQFFYAKPDPRRAARHFLLAGEKEHAARCLLDLARQAHQAADSATTLRLVQKIQKLGLIGPYRNEILYLRAASYTWMGRLALGLDDVREVLAQPGIDARLRAKAASLGCLQVRRLADPEEGLRLAQIAITEAATFDDLTLMATGYFHASFAHYDSANRAGIATCLQALHQIEARNPSLSVFRVEVQYLLAVTDLDYESAIDLGKQALALNRTLANYPRLGANLANLGLCLRSLGRFKEALSYLSMARTVYTRQGNKLQRYDATMNEGWLLALLGRFDEALALLSEAQRGFTKAGESHYRVVVEMLTARTLAARGGSEDLTQALEILTNNQVASGHLMGKTARNQAVMEVYLGIGQAKQACSAAEAALDLVYQFGDAQESTSEALALAALCFREVDHPRTQEAVDRASHLLQQLLGRCVDPASTEGICRSIQAHRLFLESYPLPGTN